MSDTTPRGDDDVLAGFDQTNDQVGGLEGQSGGTADGESRSDADQGDPAAGGVLDESTAPTVGGATHIGNDQPQDGGGI